MQALPALNQTLRQNDRRMPTVANAVLVGSIAIAELPFLAIFFRRLWGNEHHRFFPVILLAFGLLIYQRWPPERTPLRFLDRFVATFALSLGFLLLASAVVLWSPWVALVGTLFTVLFLLIHFAGGEALPRLLSAWLLLWFLLPLPGNLDRQVILALQSISSQTASTWLDVLGYDHILSGHVIHIPSQKFVVEEACSGSNSFFVLLSLTAIFVVALRWYLLIF